MPESVYFSVIFGNGLGRSFSPSSNSSWCIFFTYPCGSRRKPSADKRNFVVIRPPPAGLVPRSRHLVRKSSADEMRVYRFLFGSLICRLLGTRERTYFCEGGSMKT